MIYSLLFVIYFWAILPAADADVSQPCWILAQPRAASLAPTLEAVAAEVMWRRGPLRLAAVAHCKLASCKSIWAAWRFLPCASCARGQRRVEINKLTAPQKCFSVVHWRAGGIMLLRLPGGICEAPRPEVYNWHFALGRQRSQTGRSRSSLDREYWSEYRVPLTPPCLITKRAWTLVKLEKKLMKKNVSN